MDKELMVKNAVILAKRRGVFFDEKSPSFRPENNTLKKRFHIVILTNTSKNTTGKAILDNTLNVLDNFDENKLANYFIDIFNLLNIERKAENI